MRNSLENQGKRTSGVYLDAEREGGSTSAGEGGIGAYDDAEAEAGGGSLATLVSGGAMIGDIEAGDCADCGADAVDERVGPGPGPEGKEGDDVAAAAEVAPVSSETSLSETALPEKNSPAEREASIEGAGGKMSDWNESDLVVRHVSRLLFVWREGENLLCAGR